MKTYRQIDTIQAKLFEEGDQDGFIKDDFAGSISQPYIKDTDNYKFCGEFGENYLCVDENGDKWLVEKSIFERVWTELV